MADMVQIRGWKQMFNDYIHEGFKNGQKPSEVKQNVVEAFRKEIFDQLMFRCRVEDLNDIPHTEKNDAIVQSIFREELKKWKALVKECRRQLGVMSPIRESDLTLGDPVQEEDDEDDGYEFVDAEDPNFYDVEPEEEDAKRGVSLA